MRFSYSDYYRKKKEMMFNKDRHEKLIGNRQFNKSADLPDENHEKLLDTTRIKRNYNINTRINYKMNQKEQKTKRNLYSTLLLAVLGSLIAVVWEIYNPITEASLINMVVKIIALIVMIVAGLVFFYSFYEKTVAGIRPQYLILLVYIILLINMVAQRWLYQIEWAFLGFIIGAIIFYDAKIDSRFLVLPAVIMLGYIPFLLAAKQNVLAEDIAVYVYYLLVVGVGLMFVENYKNAKNSVDLLEFLRTNKIKNIKSVLIVSSLLTALVIVMNRFWNLELLKFSAIFFTGLALVYFLLTRMSQE